MANKNIIIAPKFTPFTFRELVEPIMAASKAQEETEEKYSILDDAVSYWESLKDSQLDQDTYQTYKKFKKKFDESRSRLLNEGLNESIRRDLMNIRSSYNSTIKPLEAAFKKREELIKEQRQYDAQNKGTLIYKKGTKASEIPLSMLVKNPAYSPESPISGALLAQQGSEVFKNLAKEIAAGNKTVLTSLLPYQYQTRTQIGMSSDDVIKAILRSNDANKKLTSLADMIISSAGIDKNVDPEAYSKAWNYVAPAMMNAVGGTSVGSASDSYGADIAKSTYNAGLGLKAEALKTYLADPSAYGGTPEQIKWIAGVSNELGVMLPEVSEEDNKPHAMGGFMSQSGDNPPRGSVAANNRRHVEQMMRRLRERQNQNNNEAGTPSAQLSAPKPIYTRGRTTSPKPTEEEKAEAKKQQKFEDYLQQVNAYGTWETLFGKNQSSDLVDRLKRTNEFYYEKGGKYYMSRQIASAFKHIEESLPKDDDGYYYIYFKDQFSTNKQGSKTRRRFMSKNKEDLLKEIYDHPEKYVFKAYKYGENSKKYNNYVWWDLLGNDNSTYFDSHPWDEDDPSTGRIYNKPDENKRLTTLESSKFDLRELKNAGITFDEIRNNNIGIMGNKWRDYYHSNKGENVGDIYGTSAYRIAIKPEQNYQETVLNKELSSNTRKKLSSVYFDGETATWKEKEELDRDKVLSGNPEATALYATPHGSVLEIKWKEGNDKNAEYHYDFIKVAGGQGTDHINNNLIAMGELAQILNKGKIPIFTSTAKLKKDKRGIIQFSRTSLSPRDLLDYYRKFKELEESMGEGAVETLWPLGQ